MRDEFPEFRHMVAQYPMRHIRQLLKITQQDMAIILGVSRLTYIKWENDVDTMPFGSYRKAAIYLNDKYELALPRVSGKDE